MKRGWHRLGKAVIALKTKRPLSGRICTNLTDRPIRFNPLIEDLAARLKAKGLAPKAIIAAAMHKLVHLIDGALKTRRPFQPDWAKSPLVTAVLPLLQKDNLVLALDSHDGI